EETGARPQGDFLPLGEVVQAGRKIVTAWGLEGDFDPATLTSNRFELEWPPKSGRKASFPEVDRAQWFSPTDARRKILAAQGEVIPRLLAAIGKYPWLPPTARPHGRQPPAQRVWLFDENARGNARGARHMGGPAFGDRGRQTRAPARERLMRPREAGEHEHVLMLAEPIAQPLRLAAPHLDEARPQRLDDVDLIAVDHDALTQLVQFLGVGVRPMRRDQPPRVAIEAGELIGDVVEGQGMKRPALDDEGRLIEGAAEAQPHVSVERRRLRRLLDRFDPPAQSGERARRQRNTVLFEVRKRIECRLCVARAGQSMGEVARLIAQAPRLFPEKGLEQP